MNPLRLIRLTLILTTLGVASAGSADTFGSLISGPFTYAYLVGGLAAPLLRDGSRGPERAARTLDSLAVTFLTTEGLKALELERRPDGRDRQSFPSGHASLAFSVATMQAQFHPRDAAYWYAGATLIGASRISERRHYFHDVLAGAALGYGISRIELSLPRGLILQPLIGAHGPRGFLLSGRF